MSTSVREQSPLNTLPMPGEKFEEATVIASSWMSDDDDDNVWGVALLLNPSTPFYTLQEITCPANQTVWERSTFSETYENIIPASAAYNEYGVY